MQHSLISSRDQYEKGSMQYFTWCGLYRPHLSTAHWTHCPSRAGDQQAAQHGLGMKFKVTVEIAESGHLQHTGHQSRTAYGLLLTGVSRLISTDEDLWEGAAKTLLYSQGLS